MMAPITTSGPLLTIGLPVYNGAKSIRDALDSLLAQDFTDFELHICDNGSTDGTEHICTEYEIRDGRIHYHRNETNLGPIANFNRAFRFCQSKYFMFAADDDIREPQFLSKCVCALEKNPQAVLASTYFDTIEPSGARGPVIDDLMETTSLGALGRLHHVLTRIHWCSAIYGVIRADALARTTLFLNLWGPDVVLLAQLALLGSFVKVRELLYHRRMAIEAPQSQRQRWEALHPVNRNRRLFLPTLWTFRAILQTIKGLDESLPCKLVLITDLVNCLGPYRVFRFLRNMWATRNLIGSKALGQGQCSTPRKERAPH